MTEDTDPTVISNNGWTSTRLKARFVVTCGRLVRHDKSWIAKFESCFAAACDLSRLLCQSRLVPGITRKAQNGSGEKVELS